MKPTSEQKTMAITNVYDNLDYYDKRRIDKICSEIIAEVKTRSRTQMFKAMVLELIGKLGMKLAEDQGEG